jgi:biotin transporter BioY
MLAGNAVIYLVALPWLAVFVAPQRILAAGMLPFLVGDLVKIGIATAALPAAWSLIGRARGSAGPDT